MSRRGALALWGTLLTAGGLYSLALGQDMNGDQRNNHTYAVWLLFHRQQDVAWGVGGVAGYLPATWDVPWYFAALHLPTPATVFLLGVLHAVAAGLAASIVWALLRGVRPRVRAAATAIAGAISVWSPAYLAEFGTTFGNVVSAIPVLGAVLLMVRRSDATPSLRRAVVFGVLLGLAFGLKLTNAVYVVAGLGALLVIGARSVEGLRAVFSAAFGAVLGTAVSGGPWFLWMAMRFGNPLFPFYNAVFHSPYGPDANLRDERFAVHAWSDALLMPFRMMLKSGYPSELDGRDIRWVLLLLLLLLALLVRLIGREPTDRWVRGSDRIFVLTFVTLGFVAWDVQFAIARYALVLEMLGGAAVVCLVDLIGRQNKARLLGLALTAGIAVPWVAVPRFFHQSPWHNSWYGFRAPAQALRPDLLVVFPTQDDASFVVAGLRSDVRAVQVPRIFPTHSYPPGVVGKEDLLVQRVIRQQQGPIVSITLPASIEKAEQEARSYGLRLDRSGCQTLHTSYRDYAVCPWLR